MPYPIALVAYREGNVSRSPIYTTVTSTCGLRRAVHRYQKRLNSRSGEIALAWVTAETARALQLEDFAHGWYYVKNAGLVEAAS